MIRASILVTIVSVLASGIGFAVQLSLAYKFGIGSDLDAYNFAFSWPSFVSGLIVSGAAISLVPRIVSQELDLKLQARFVYSNLVGFIGLAVALPIAGVLLAVMQIGSLPTGSPIADMHSLWLLIVLAWCAAGAQVLQGAISAVLNAQRMHVTAALCGVAPYVGMVIGLLLVDVFGIIALPASILGVTLSLIPWSMRLALRRFTDIQYIRGHLGHFFETLGEAPFSLLSTAMFTFYSVVDAYWAPRAGAGTLAIMALSQRILIGVGNLAVAGPVAVLAPKFAATLRDSGIAAFRRLLMRSVVAVFVLAGVVACFLLLLRHVFARYVSVSQRQLKESLLLGETIAAMLPGMMFMLVGAIGLRALFCLRTGKLHGAVIGGVWMLLYAVLSYLLVDRGSVGLGTAYSLTWFVCLCLLSLSIEWSIRSTANDKNYC